MVGATVTNTCSAGRGGFQETRDPVGADPTPVRECKHWSWRHHTRSYNPSSPSMGDLTELSSPGWWLYMILIAVFRGTLERRYIRASAGYKEISGWRAAVTIGAGLAGTGWG